MIQASVARRYARALFSLGLESGEHERFGEELEAIAAAIRTSREARDLVHNPAYSAQQRQAIVDALSAQLKLSPTVVTFLRLLVDKKRLGEVEAIARSYRELLDAHVGRLRAVVTSAAPLSGDELARVRDAIAAVTRRTIVLEAKTDPAIVGGMVAQVGATLWDGSLRTQLERMRAELKQGAL